jgi:hypothetical protein
MGHIWENMGKNGTYIIVIGDFLERGLQLVNKNYWLVVEPPTPLKNIMSSSVGMMTFPIYGKIKHVPNHQPDYDFISTTSTTLCIPKFGDFTMFFILKDNNVGFKITKITLDTNYLLILKSSKPLHCLGKHLTVVSSFFTLPWGSLGLIRDSQDFNLDHDAVFDAYEAIEVATCLGPNRQISALTNPFLPDHHFFKLHFLIPVCDSRAMI